VTPTEVFDTYWRFAAERQAVYMRRLTDPVGPWTEDPILLTYRFTNAYRASDRVSQFLIRDVQYGEGRSQDPAEVFFRTFLFNVTKKVETWERLERELGPLTLDSDFGEISRIANDARAAGEVIFTAAYVIPTPKFDREGKFDNWLALLAVMLDDDDLPSKLRNADNLKEVYTLLNGYPGMGPFLAFQYAIDLNYSTLLDHDEDQFVVAGPGALDGISKCFSDLGGLAPKDVIYEMVDSQEENFDRLGLDFPGLFGRRLQPIDCQNLFCEISKYARVAHPDVAGVAGRTKIKQNYRQDAQPFPTPVFPPKWDLSAAVAATLGQPLPAAA
jgi:hypothetical protein